VTAQRFDVWHFICEEPDGLWTWRRVSPTGHALATSMFSFKSFNGCVADAERAGYVTKSAPVRRVHSSTAEHNRERASHSAHNEQRSHGRSGSEHAGTSA
jgi:hypothetical protein